MATKRESILSAIATALSGTAGVSTRIYRTRVDPVDRAASPALIIQPLRDVCLQRTLSTLDWTLTVRITVIERASIPDQAADDTIESLHSKVMSDLTLGGVAQDVVPVRTEFDFVEADQPAAVIGCEYEIKYRTELDDLSQ